MILLFKSYSMNVEFRSFMGKYTVSIKPRTSQDMDGALHTDFANF